MNAYPLLIVIFLHILLNSLLVLVRGDPISGLLFILSLEPLLRNLKELNIQSLAYADDVALVLNSESQIEEAISVIKTFRIFLWS
jgi:hypothetical protein